MTQKQDSKGELRAALVTLFMSLLMVGTPGPAFVSLLFLVALLMPLFAKMFRKLRSGRKENKAQANTELTPEVQNEG